VSRLWTVEWCECRTSQDARNEDNIKDGGNSRYMRDERGRGDLYLKEGEGGATTAPSKPSQKKVGHKEGAKDVPSTPQNGWKGQYNQLPERVVCEIGLTEKKGSAETQPRVPDREKHFAQFARLQEFRGERERAIFSGSETSPSSIHSGRFEGVIVVQMWDWLLGLSFDDKSARLEVEAHRPGLSQGAGVILRSKGPSALSSKTTHAPQHKSVQEVKGCVAFKRVSKKKKGGWSLVGAAGLNMGASSLNYLRH